MSMMQIFILYSDYIWGCKQNNLLYGDNRPLTWNNIPCQSAFATVPCANCVIRPNTVVGWQPDNLLVYVCVFSFIQVDQQLSLLVT